MLWGARWGDFWGSNKKLVTDVRAQRSSVNGGEVVVAVDATKASAKLHVHVNGYKKQIQGPRTFAVAAPASGEAVIEVVPSGPNSSDLAYATERFLRFQAFAYRTLEWLQTPAFIESGDAANQLSSWSITGTGVARGGASFDWINGRTGRLYVYLRGSGFHRYVYVYRDSAMASADLVMYGARNNDGAITLAQQNASGLSGSVTVAYTADTTAIKMDWSFPLQYSVRWDNKTGTIIETDLAVLTDDNLLGTADLPFRWSSPVLTAGAYKFRVDCLDDAGNRKTGTEVNVTVDLAPNAVSALALVYNPATRLATLTWVDPVDADLASLSVRQFLSTAVPPDAPTASVAVGTKTWVSGVLTGPAIYNFRVNALDAGGNEELSSLTLTLELDAANNQVNPRPNAPFSLAVTPLAAGKFQVVADYDQRGEAAVATHVHFFHDAGLGAGVDWTTVIAQADLAALGETKRATYAESAAFADGTTVVWGARAVTAGGVDDGGTALTETGQADAVAPPDAPTVTVRLGRWD